MSHIIHRSLRAVPRTAVSAQGVWITDAQGHRYLDASGGAAAAAAVREGCRLALRSVQRDGRL